VKVSIVVPWLDHHELWGDFYGALRGETPHEVIVVDNASTPPLRFVANKLNLRVVRQKHNLGFAAGCNAGFEETTGDAVLFLNNDVTADESGWLKRLADQMEPGVLVGAQLRYDDHGWVDGKPYPYLDGWCMGGLRDELAQFGPFDDDYEEPGYFTDNDLCVRARAAGMRLREVRLPMLHHMVSTTSGPVDDERLRLLDANQERYQEVVREIVGQPEPVVS